ncbi:formate dehydrogenase [Methylobacterium gossipiicola]|uniref:Formate dehydrogenase region TAT target n=1 Tax=Methylobacterium gossipiicola TaxID=582675 RepID=A0A1I2V679_9HYPH|nr:formate dehydrogenase [Methylobacterium gossipiicola]SFG84854.1 formate dehydrogenase region TAT target [Methylobacterium gossipiicola]
MRQDQKDTQDGLGRRQFFRALGGGTVAVAAGVAATPMTATDAQAYDPGQDETKGRYRLTDHVKAFYRTNGYETLVNNTNAADKK